MYWHEELPVIAGGNAKRYSYFGRWGGKRNILLAHFSVISTSWELPKWIENLMSTEKPAHNVLAAFFVTTKPGKQPRCPLVGEWINKLVYQGIGISFSTEKKWSVKPQRKLKWILLSERRQSKKATTVWFQPYDILEKANCGYSKKIGLQEFEVGRKGWIGKAERIFRAVKVFCVL